MLRLAIRPNRALLKVPVAMLLCMRFVDGHRADERTGAERPAYCAVAGDVKVRGRLQVVRFRMELTLVAAIV